MPMTIEYMVHEHIPMRLEKAEAEFMFWHQIAEMKFLTGWPQFNEEGCGR